MDDYWDANTGDSSGVDFWDTNTGDSSGGDFWDINTYVPDMEALGVSKAELDALAGLYADTGEQKSILGNLSDLASKAGAGILGLFKNKDGSINWGRVAGTAGGALGLLNAMRSTPQAPATYQGGIPKYTAVRERVPIADDPNRRPGAGGRRYFSDVSYLPKKTDEAGLAALQTAKTAAQEQAKSLVEPMYAAPKTTVGGSNSDGSPLAANTQTPVTNAASSVINMLPVPKYDASGKTIPAAGGGLMTLAQGRYLNGETDGMADKIPANIDGKQPAALSHGEFVIPADVVSHLGNGNSEAGAKRLYEMMDRIRTARTGTKKQGKQINPSKYLPR